MLFQANPHASTFTVIPESNLSPEESLRERLEADPADWNARLRIACLLYDQEDFPGAAALIWEAERIPCRALDLASAACILAKDQPGKAIRLLTAVLENNRGMAAQNMGMANALLHHGMVLQSARFYGAALGIDPELVNPEFEHFFVWADDEQLLWENFNGRRTQLHDLPWMTRDPMESIELIRDASRHTTPIAVPRLNQIEVESTAIEALRGKLAENSEDWDTRQTLAQLLHDQGASGEAAALIWESDPIPSADLDIAFAARVLAKGKPRNAIRLLTAVFEQNLGKAVQNMAVANALLHHGLVLESARFYGAAVDADPNLVNPDLEHFLLWTDDAGSLWENFLKIRPPLGIFPWAQSDPTLDFGADFPTRPIVLSGLRQVQGENLTNHLYQQSAGRNARITPPPAVTFPADRAALNDLRPDSNSRGTNGRDGIAEEEAKVEAAAKARADEQSRTLALAKQQKEQEERAAAAAKRIADEQAAAEVKAASLFAEAAESARTLLEQARQEATTEVAAIRAKAQEELEAALAQAHQKTELEMAALRAKAREEAEAAADAARKEAELQAALIRAKAEEAAAEAEAAAKLRAEEYARAFALAKHRAEEEERSIATAKRLAEEQANAAAEQAAAAKVAADKARQEATSEVAAMRAKAEEELKASLDQARQNSEQELAALRAKAREKAESEAALIRTKAEEDARVAEKTRLEATAQAEAAAKLRAKEDARALALAKQRADEEERSTAAAKRLAEEQARAAAEKIREEAAAEVLALRAKAQEELKASIEQARRNTEEELAAMRAKAGEEAKKASAAAEQARLETAAKAKAAAEILARAEEEAQAAAAQQARQEALAELAAIKAQAQEELQAAAEQARLNSEQELKMLRAKAREESKMLMENALKEATSQAALISPGPEENVMLGSSVTEDAPAEDVAGAAAVPGVRDEQQGTIPIPHAVEKARIEEHESTGKRRFWVLLVSAAITMGCWKFLPGSAPDRVLFSTVAGSFANPPLFVSGNGTHASPWKLNTMTAEPKPDKREAPVVVSLGDDLGAFFQSSPPAPIDLAVIFSNFHRLGARKAATAAVLAWEAPDPIGLAALDKALGKFDSLVMAAPLSRGAVSSAMPAAFRRASLPLTQVHGDTTSLPSVNRIPLPGVIFGGEKSSAGFSTLESEPSSEFPPLIARWEDCVVFAFPLLTVLQRNNFPLEGVEIRLGEYIKLSPSGPVVPLDDYGRLATPIKPMAAFKEISAEAIIDGGDGLFPKTAPDPVILRDDQSAAEPATRAFSKKLSAMVAAIASDQGFASISAYPRLSEKIETGILAFFVIALTTLCGLPAFSRHITFSVLAGTALSAQWIGVGMASVWLPLLPCLAAIATAAVVSHLIRESSPAPANELIEPPVETEPVVETAPTPEPKPKKPGASKKSPAEKPAEKKPPAKKAATPRKPRTKKRRTDK